VKHLFAIVFLSVALVIPVVHAQETFTISTSYQNLLSNSEGTGMLDLILNEAFRRIGMKVEFVYTTTGKSLVDVNAGVFDGEINRIAGMETQYPDLRRVPEPNMVMDFVAFATKPFRISGWESIRDLDIGLVRGWKILEDNTKGFPNVVTLPTELELFNMLRKGRIDVALYDLYTGYVVLNELGMKDAVSLDPPLASREMFLYVHKKHDALRDRIAVALREMKADGTWSRIVAQVRTAYGIPSR